MTQWHITLLFLASFAVCCNGDNLVVETTTGPVRGIIMTSLTNKPIRAFHGIPYAEPPVGRLRFKPPVPIRPWKDVLDATKRALPCYQQYTRKFLSLHRKIGAVVRRPWSEDCLTLNVWTPAVVPHDAPVMIFIHDGGFMVGSGAAPYMDSSTMSSESETVVVTLNYRLGAFGFLSLGISDISGNMGLMDQHLALKWLHDNIESFGGKTSALFLIGLGAGAASVGFHVVLPENSGLFKTGMLFGGSPLCSWAWHSKETATELGKILSHSLGCESHNFTSETECLQDAHPEDIIDAYLLDGNRNKELFKPNIDGEFIRENPHTAMKEGRFNNVTVIISNSMRDAALRFFNLNEDILTADDSGLTTQGFREAIKRSELTENETELEVIQEWYMKFSKKMNATEIREAAVEAYTDGLSVCCAEEFLSYATEHGVLTFRKVMDIPDAELPAWIGSHDLVPLRIILGDTIDPKRNYNEAVLQMTMHTMNIIKIYTRKKAIEFTELIPLYNLDERPYLFWQGYPTHLKRFRTEKCVLWNDILPTLRKRTSCKIN